jgi:predicted nucleic acid-binding protein
MHLVDSSVWTDFFNGSVTPATDQLAVLLAGSEVCVGDLILTEVLQGFASDRHFGKARSALLALPLVTISDKEVALLAAANYRSLRKRGITVRKTVDTLIATRCIRDGYPLLYSDRDFDPFVEHLGLVSAMGGQERG